MAIAVAAFLAGAQGVSHMGGVRGVGAGRPRLTTPPPAAAAVMRLAGGGGDEAGVDGDAHLATPAKVGFLSSLFRCFGLCSTGAARRQQSAGRKDADGSNALEKKLKHKVGRLERKVRINAPLSRVYRVCSDYEHYGDWTGNGIKKCVIAERRQGFTHVIYTTGVFGFFFDFALYWSTAVQNKITFRNPGPMGAVHLLKGEYVFKDLGEGKTEVGFQIIADLRGPYPQFIKVAIAKLIVHIALDDLKTYVQSQRCIDTLAKYDAEAQKGAFKTFRDHITKHFIDVPDMAFMKDGGVGLAKKTVIFAALGLFFKRYVLRGRGRAARWRQCEAKVLNVSNGRNVAQGASQPGGCDLDELGLNNYNVFQRK